MSAPMLDALGVVGEAEGIHTGIYPLRWDYEAGDVREGHTHGAPHATLVASGRFRFINETTGTSRDVAAFDWIAVDTHDLHRFECVEAGTIFCVFVSPDGRPVTP